MRLYVAQHATPMLLAYWLGRTLPEIEADPVSAVDDSAAMLYHLLNRENWRQTVNLADA